MTMNFTGYLFSIMIMMVIVGAFSVLLLLKLFRKGRGSEKPQLISGGNVSILFDSGRNVLIIPYVKDKMGVGRATDGPQRLQMPYSADRLGYAIRYSMRMCLGGKPITSSELMSQLGCNAWKDFSEGKRSISINYVAGKGITFNTTTRRMDGSYQFNHFGIERSVGADVGDRELGETVLELLARCKA